MFINQYVEITQEALIVSKNPSIQKSMLYKKKGGKGWFNMNRCLKITRFACPAAQAPLLHCTTTRVMIMTTRHKYDNHTLPNETHSLQNDLNVACLRELSQQSIASNTHRRIHIE
jgi:hypothetical protein